MLGHLDPNKNDVIVVGGGIAGLLAAYRLDLRGYRVSLIESQDRLGGIIQTDQTPWGITERGPHSILATQPVLKLCHELGLSLLPVNPGARSRFILRNGRMRRFPLTLREATGTLFQLLKSLRRKTHHPHSLADWGELKLGQPAVDYLLNPFTKGIYGANPAEISLSAAFPFLQTRQAGQGRLFFLRPRAQMMTPEHGMGQLTHALAATLSQRLAGRIHTGKTIKNVSDLGSHANLVLCVPAYQAADLLRVADPVLASSLDQVRYTPMICVTVFLKKVDFRTALPNGVGVLMPDRENRDILGILYNSSSFRNRATDNQMVSCSVMLGGTSHPDFLRLEDQEIREIVQKELKSLFGFQGDLAAAFIHRWEKAIPLYSSQLEQSWHLARNHWCSKPGNILFGNYTGKVSIRGMIETEIT